MQGIETPKKASGRGASRAAAAGPPSARAKPDGRPKPATRRPTPAESRPVASVPGPAPTPAGREPGPQVQRLLVDEASEGQRLDNFLFKSLKGVPKTHVYRVIRSGEVRVNKARAAADSRLALGDEVRVPPVRVAHASEQTQRPTPAREFPVVFEDEHLLVVNKPAGVAVHGGSGVSFGVIEQLRQARPLSRFLELVHRLDKETSGLLIIAKKRSALVSLQAQFRQRETGKTYAALVWGTWPLRLKVVDTPLFKTLDAQGERRVLAVDSAHPHGQRSISLVQRVGHWAAPEPGLSLLDVTIKTGRTHQIRVHLQSQGHPIVGDERYGDFALNKAMSRGEVLPDCRLERMFLHARRLRFEHPHTQQVLELEAPLPPECTALLEGLSAVAGAAASPC